MGFKRSIRIINTEVVLDEDSSAPCFCQLCALHALKRGLALSYQAWTVGILHVSFSFCKTSQASIMRDIMKVKSFATHVLNMDHSAFKVVQWHARVAASMHIQKCYFFDSKKMISATFSLKGNYIQSDLNLWGLQHFLNEQ